MLTNVLTCNEGTRGFLGYTFFVATGYGTKFNQCHCGEFYGVVACDAMFTMIQRGDKIGETVRTRLVTESGSLSTVFGSLLRAVRPKDAVEVVWEREAVVDFELGVVQVVPNVVGPREAVAVVPAQRRDVGVVLDQQQVERVHWKRQREQHQRHVAQMLHRVHR